MCARRFASKSGGSQSRNKADIQWLHEDPYSASGAMRIVRKVDICSEKLFRWRLWV
jgi:hypothetical protein